MVTQSYDNPQVKVFQTNLGANTKLWAPRRMARKTFQTEVPQISKARLQNFVSNAVQRPGFVQPCSNQSTLKQLSHKGKEIASNYTSSSSSSSSSSSTSSSSSSSSSSFSSSMTLQSNEDFLLFNGLSQSALFFDFYVQFVILLSIEKPTSYTISLFLWLLVSRHRNCMTYTLCCM